MAKRFFPLLFRILFLCEAGLKEGLHGIAGRSSHELGIGQVNESFPGPLRLIIEQTAAVLSGAEEWKRRNGARFYPQRRAPRSTETGRNKIANLNNSRLIIIFDWSEPRPEHKYFATTPYSAYGIR